MWIIELVLFMTFLGKICIQNTMIQSCRLHLIQRICQRSTIPKSGPVPNLYSIDHSGNGQLFRYKNDIFGAKIQIKLLFFRILIWYVKMNTNKNGPNK